MMSTYIVEASERESKKTADKHSILTKNRLQTIEKREVSLDFLFSDENQKDAGSYIYSLDMKKKEDKNKMLCRKDSLTEEDYKNTYIKQIEDTIKELKSKIDNPEYDYKEDIPKIKAIIIELKKDQYTIKNSINGTFTFAKMAFSKKAAISYYQPTGYTNQENEYIFINDSTFWFHKSGHLAALLQNYSMLKQQSADDPQSTIYWILSDFDELVNYAYKDAPNVKYQDILKYKMIGYTNEEINELLIKKYGSGYAIVYISSLINKVIPAFLASKYQEYVYNWVHFYKVKGKWKKCSKCGQIKLASRYNFSLNKRGKFGFHSVCKKCR